MNPRECQTRPFARTLARVVACVALTAATLVLAGCTTRVGVGMNVGMPIGARSYVAVGSSRWF